MLSQHIIHVWMMSLLRLALADSSSHVDMTEPIYNCSDWESLFQTSIWRQDTAALRRIYDRIYPSKECAPAEVPSDWPRGYCRASGDPLEDGTRQFTAVFRRPCFPSEESSMEYVRCSDRTLRTVKNLVATWPTLFTDVCDWDLRSLSPGKLSFAGYLTEQSDDAARIVQKPDPTTTIYKSHHRASSTPQNQQQSPSDMEDTTEDSKPNHSDLRKRVPAPEPASHPESTQGGNPNDGPSASCTKTTTVTASSPPQTQTTTVMVVSTLADPWPVPAQSQYSQPYSQPAPPGPPISSWGGPWSGGDRPSWPGAGGGAYPPGTSCASIPQPSGEYSVLIVMQSTTITFTKSVQPPATVRLSDLLNGLDATSSSPGPNGTAYPATQTGHWEVYGTSGRTGPGSTPPPRLATSSGVSLDIPSWTWSIGAMAALAISFVL